MAGFRGGLAVLPIALCSLVACGDVQTDSAAPPEQEINYEFEEGGGPGTPGWSDALARLVFGFEDEFACQRAEAGAIRGRLMARHWYGDRPAYDAPFTGAEVRLQVFARDNTGASGLVHEASTRSATSHGGFRFEGVPVGGLAQVDVIDSRLRGGRATLFRLQPTDSLFLRCWNPLRDRDYLHVEEAGVP